MAGGSHEVSFGFIGYLRFTQCFLGITAFCFNSDQGLILLKAHQNDVALACGVSQLRLPRNALLHCNLKSVPQKCQITVIPSVESPLSVGRMPRRCR
jgi:hypothetical protein